MTDFLEGSSKEMNIALVLVLIICYAVWGGGMIAMKFAFESFTAGQVVFARVSMAAIFYFCIFFKWWRIPYKKGDWKYLIMLVAFEPCLFFLFETFSLKYTTASQAGVIAACFPIWTAIAAWLFLGEKLNKLTIMAIILAVIGVAGASYFAGEDSRASNPLLGNLLMLGATLSSSAYAVCARYITRRYSFLAISAIQAIGGTLVFLPLLFMDGCPHEVTKAALGGLFYMGIGVGLIVYLIFNYSLQHMKAGVVALFGNLIPVFTLIFASLILKERITAAQGVFIAITLTGVTLATIKKDQDK